MRHLGAWLRALAMRRLRVTPGFYEYGGATATAAGPKPPLLPWDRSPDAEVRPRGLNQGLLAWESRRCVRFCAFFT